MTKARAIGLTGAAGAALALVAGRLARRRRGLAALVGAAGAACAWSAYRPNHPAFGRVRWRGPANRSAVAITFDDGPGPSTAAVLDALAARGARATFFVLGRQARRHPDLVRRIVAEGHQLASHGDDHGILIFRGLRHVRDQLRRTEEAVAEAAGDGTLSRWFRAPHGFRGPLTGLAAARAGYRMAGWTRGVWDSAEPGAEVIAARAAEALRPGTVLLLHDADGWDPDRRRDQTAAALPLILDELARRGLEAVTFSEITAR